MLRHKKKVHSLYGIPLCIITTGFARMIFDLVVIFAFQSIYGYVFSWMGMLVTAFMAGSACGAMITTWAADRTRNVVRLFQATEAGIIFLALALPITFKAANAVAATIAAIIALKVWFLLVSFGCGLLTGAQFPLANKVYLYYHGNLSRTAGLLYACDLLGGWLGGIIGGVALLPVIGLSGTCITIGLLKLASFIVISRTSKLPVY